MSPPPRSRPRRSNQPIPDQHSRAGSRRPVLFFGGRDERPLVRRAGSVGGDADATFPVAAPPPAPVVSSSVALAPPFPLPSPPCPTAPSSARPSFSPARPPSANRRSRSPSPKNTAAKSFVPMPFSFTAIFPSLAPNLPWRSVWPCRTICSAQSRAPMPRMPRVSPTWRSPRSKTSSPAAELH